MEGEITSIKYKQTGHARILEKKKPRRAAQGYLTLKSSCPLCRHSPSCFIIFFLKKRVDRYPFIALPCCRQPVPDTTQNE